MMHSLCLRHVALAATFFTVMNVEAMGRDEEDRARGEDVTVFVNANILKLLLTQCVWSYHCYVNMHRNG